MVGEIKPLARLTIRKLLEKCLHGYQNFTVICSFGLSAQRRSIWVCTPYIPQLLQWSFEICKAGLQMKGFLIGYLYHRQNGWQRG